MRTFIPTNLAGFSFAPTLSFSGTAPFTNNEPQAITPTFYTTAEHRFQESIFPFRSPFFANGFSAATPPDPEKTAACLRTLENTYCVPYDSLSHALPAVIEILSRPSQSDDRSQLAAANTIGVMAEKYLSVSAAFPVVRQILRSQPSTQSLICDILLNAIITARKHHEDFREAYKIIEEVFLQKEAATGVCITPWTKAAKALTEDANEITDRTTLAKDVIDRACQSKNPAIKQRAEDCREIFFQTLLRIGLQGDLLNRQEEKAARQLAKAPWLLLPVAQLLGSGYRYVTDDTAGERAQLVLEIDCRTGGNLSPILPWLAKQIFEPDTKALTWSSLAESRYLHIFRLALRSKPSSAAAVNIIAGKLSSSKSRDRERAIEILSFDWGDELTPVVAERFAAPLAKLLRDEFTPGSGDQAKSLLCEFVSKGDAAARPVLLACATLLASEDRSSSRAAWEIFEAAAEKVATLDGIENVVRALDDSKNSVMAARVLQNAAKHKPSRQGVLNALERSMALDRQTMRGQVANILANLVVKDETRDAVIELLKKTAANKGPLVRALTATAIGKAVSKGVVPDELKQIVETLRTDPHHRVRSDAEWALKQFAAADEKAAKAKAEEARKKAEEEAKQSAGRSAPPEKSVAAKASSPEEIEAQELANALFQGPDNPKWQEAMHILATSTGSWKNDPRWPMLKKEIVQKLSLDLAGASWRVLAPWRVLVFNEIVSDERSNSLVRHKICEIYEDLVLNGAALSQNDLEMLLKLFSSHNDAVLKVLDLARITKNRRGEFTCRTAYLAVMKAAIANEYGEDVLKIAKASLAHAKTIGDTTAAAILKPLEDAEKAARLAKKMEEALSNTNLDEAFVYGSKKYDAKPARDEIMEICKTDPSKIPVVTKAVRKFIEENKDRVDPALVEVFYYSLNFNTWENPLPQEDIKFLRGFLITIIDQHPYVAADIAALLPPENPPAAKQPTRTDIAPPTTAPVATPRTQAPAQKVIARLASDSRVMMYKITDKQPPQPTANQLQRIQNLTEALLSADPQIQKKAAADWASEVSRIVDLEARLTDPDHIAWPVLVKVLSSYDQTDIQRAAKRLAKVIIKPTNSPSQKMALLQRALESDDPKVKRGAMLIQKQIEILKQ